jgi:hypothetical protein
MTPSGDRPFANPDDYKILYNDWPYGVQEDVAHLVVWTKFMLEEDAAADDLSLNARATIETFVQHIFCGQPGVPRGNLVWFRNWKSLKSVHALGESDVATNRTSADHTTEHFHVMLYKAPPGFLKQVTNGDQPMSAVMNE